MQMDFIYFEVNAFWSITLLFFIPSIFTAWLWPQEGSIATHMLSIDHCGGLDIHNAPL